jgi:argininosuccinate lyase
MHLSRLAEEIIVWMSAPFSFVRLPDRWTTGSSIMPQKRNPDAAELVRGKTGRVVGALAAVLTMMKGLPLAYSKDMQEDKEQLFDAADTLELVLAATTGMIRDLEPVPERMAALAGSGFATATDLADWLVGTLGVPFRDAHHITGRIVAEAERRGCGLEGLPLDAMQAVEPRIDGRVYEVLGVENSVRSRTSFGGTSPVRVAEQVAWWKGRI